MSSGVELPQTFQQQQQQQQSKSPAIKSDKQVKVKASDGLASKKPSVIEDNGDGGDDRDETPDIAVDATKNTNSTDKRNAKIQKNVLSNEDSNIPTPNSVIDPTEDSAPLGDEEAINDDDDDTTIKNGNDNASNATNDPDETNGDTPGKRRDSEAPEGTPKPKRSRKLQGAGVKKPLYSRYESLYIVKAFKSISDRHPNLVLIDLFKIVGILFNAEANRQGFKERTPDQLYQKYKRIQHGLNHGETEFLDFFRQNKYNPREWIPDFSSVENDEILKYIKFPNLDDAINEVLGSSVANLKPPLPDLYDDDDDDDEKNTQITTSTLQKAEINEQTGEDEELLKLAGYNDGNGSGNRKPSLTKDMKTKIQQLETAIAVQQREIDLLKEGMAAKEQEITFLKSMIKEDLSYIRHKLNEPNSKAEPQSATTTTYTKSSSSLKTPSSKIS